MKHVVLITSAVVALAAASTVYVRSQSQPEVTVVAGPAGLTSLQCDGKEMLHYGAFRVNQVTLRKASGETWAGQTQGTVISDTAHQRTKIVFPWGEVTIRYTTSQNRLDIGIETANTSSTDTIQGLWYEPLVLRFPTTLSEYDGSIPLLTHTIGNPAILQVSFDTGTLVMAADDMSKPLMLGFPWSTNKPKNTIFPLTVNTDRVKSYPDSYPVIQRPIAPGARDEFQISMRFGRPRSTLNALAPDVYRKYAQQFPSRLNWDDRRPIGAIFLASAGTNTSNNPRGWLSNSRVDITTDVGRDQFRRQILALADSSIAILRQMNAQGAITWDIEGQENGHSISYIGDPRQLPHLAPEMNLIADEYFRRFREAGFRVGVCVRPQQLVNEPKIAQVSVPDSTELLINKIRYAKDRWGATLIYVDSNVNPTDPNPLDGHILAKVAAAFPDVLLIPEHSNFEYYSFSAPYRELRQGYTSTPEAVRAAYPKAFSFIATSDGLLDYHHDSLASSLKRGDSVIYRTWYPDPQNEKVKSLYR